MAAFFLVMRMGPPLRIRFVKGVNPSIRRFEVDRAYVEGTKMIKMSQQKPLMSKLWVPILPVGSVKMMDTPLKTNMSPENQWLEDALPYSNSPFLGDMLVFWGVFLFKS